MAIGGPGRISEAIARGCGVIECTATRILERYFILGRDGEVENDRKFVAHCPIHCDRLI